MEFCHHKLSSFLFVDLSVELASNWHGAEATRNQGPFENLIFCIYFGHEEKVDAKRSARLTVKVFQTFTTRCYLQHINGQNPNKWADYCGVTKDHKKFFQDDDSLFVNKISDQFDSYGTL